MIGLLKSLFIIVEVLFTPIIFAIGNPELGEAMFQQLVVEQIINFFKQSNIIRKGGLINDNNGANAFINDTLDLSFRNFPVPEVGCGSTVGVLGNVVGFSSVI